MSNQLPTLAELHHDPQQAFKNDQLNLLLYQPPHASWLKDHPTAKAKNNQGQLVPAKYLPIDKVEFLLTYIFQQWRVEVISVQALFQSIGVHVRLHIINPLTGVWFYHDGVGAAPIQTDAGKSAADLSAIKAAAVQIALPAAESYAIKDAAEKLGTLFGKDLNRRDTIMFAGAYSQVDPVAPAPQPSPAATQQQQYQPLPMSQFGQYAQQVPHPVQQPQAQYQAQPQSFNFNPAAL